MSIESIAESRPLPSADDVLREMLALAERYPLAKGQFAVDREGQAVAIDGDLACAFCTVGFETRALRALLPPSSARGRVAHEVERRLAGAITTPRFRRQLAAGRQIYNVLVSWNDQAASSNRSVQRLVRRALDQRAED